MGPISGWPHLRSIARRLREFGPQEALDWFAECHVRFPLWNEADRRLASSR